MKIVVSEFVSLDGVMEDPGGAEGYKNGGWSFKFNRGPEGDKFKVDELSAAGALLLGRVTYQGFAKAWPAIKDPDGFAAGPKHQPAILANGLRHPVPAASGFQVEQRLFDQPSGEGQHVL